MTPQMKRLLMVVGALAALMTVSVLAVGSYVRHQGMVVVEVWEAGGTDVRIRIPAAAIQILMPFMPDAILADPSDGWRTWGPFVGSVARNLADCPDCVLVEASSAAERVRIVKERDCFLVEVDAPGERVRISVPLSVVGHVLSRIDRSGGTFGMGMWTTQGV